MHETEPSSGGTVGQHPHVWDALSYEGHAFQQLANQEAEVKGVEFFQCTFDRCRFSKTNFRGCRFEECVFETCDLSLMKVTDCSFLGVRFQKSKLLGIDWTKAKTLRIALHSSDVSHSMFMDMRLPGFELLGCKAREVDFSGASLTRAVLTQTDFLGARFVNTDLSHADFSNAVNYTINPNSNRLTKTVFTLPEAVSLLQAFDIVLK